MAVRTVTVRLRADISNYTRGMRQAARNTSDLAGAGAAVSTALVAGFAVAAASAAKFDKALSNVRAVTGASAADMNKLRAAALEAGRTTAFSAYEAADAEAELARAGVAVSDIVGGALKGSLSLAAAGQVDLAESATIAAQAMNTFGLRGKDVSHVADLLAAGANKSAADVHGLGESLRMGGLLAHQTGLSIEDTVGVLSAFADHALIGSDAGTSLKVMLQRLVPQSQEAQSMMEKLGFSAYDSSGQFVGLSELAGRMKTSFSKLTPEARNAAFATIFGSDAVRSATILYELGAKGVNRYVRSVNDQGAASRMAGIQMDNLMGDLQKLRGALEVALIEGGSAANGALREMTQMVTGLVNAYNNLPPGLQHAVTLFGGFAGATGLAATGLLLLLPRIAATRAALAQMGVTAATTRSAMMTLGRLSLVVGGLAAVNWATSALMDQFKEAPPNVTKMTNALVNFAQKGKAAGELTKAFGKDLDGFGDAVRRIAHPSGMERVVNAMEKVRQFGDDDVKLAGAKDKIKALDKALADLVSAGSPDVAARAFQRMAREAEAQGTSTEKLRTLLPQYAEALSGMDTQQKLTADGQKKLGDSAGMTTGELQDQRTAAEKLTDALKTLNGLNISVAEQEIAFRQSLADLTGAVKDNGHSLDVTSEKGRKVKGAFLDAAKAAQEHAQAVADQQGTVEAGNAVLERDIAALKRTMRQAGFSEDAIRKLTAAYAQLPAEKTTDVGALGAQRTIRDLEAIRQKIKDVPPGKSVKVKAPTKGAVDELKRLGFKVTHLPHGRVRITVPTSAQKRGVDALASSIRNLRDRSITITTNRVTTVTRRTFNVPDYFTPRADGAVADYYAQGGIRHFARGAEQHVAQIAPAGAWRVFAEPETGGEAYIPLASSKRVRSRAIAEETVRRLGGKGIAWYADGGFTYSPTGMPVLGGPSDPKQRYDDLVAKLKDAWKDYQDALKEMERVRRRKHTKKELDAAKRRVRSEYADVKELDKALGIRPGAKAPSSFNLKAYQKQLGNSLAATERWRKNLERIGRRGGEDIRALLESMGEDGYALVNSLAGASDKQFKDIVSKLKRTGDLAKATLADFTKQLGAHTKQSEQFSKDLQTLAAKGFGDLAQALAAQGDESAMALAHQAATGKASDVAKANTAVSKANTTLTGDDLANALVLLTTLRGGPGRGYAELTAAGLDVSTIRTLVPRMLDQINRLPQAYKEVFLKQWAGQTGVTAMAAGGILNRPTMVLGGEAGVRESWIPWDGSARSRSLLAATASAAGYRLVPAGRYGGGHQTTAALAREVSKHITVHLHGAKQTTAEQAHDIARHLAFAG